MLEFQRNGLYCNSAISSGDTAVKKLLIVLPIGAVIIACIFVAVTRHIGVTRHEPPPKAVAPLPDAKAFAQTPVSSQLSDPPSSSSQEDRHRYYETFAYRAIGGKLNIPNPNHADVREEGERVIVTFLLDQPRVPPQSLPNPPGPDYRAQVTFDRRNGRVIEVLSGS